MGIDKKIEVILLERVGKQLPGQLTSVQKGFFRNYLGPKGKAVLATEESKLYYKNLNDKRIAEDQRNLEIAREISLKLGEITPMFERAAMEDGTLYGSVSSQDLVEYISSVASHSLTESQIVIHNKIKNLGTHEIEINLHPEVKLKLNVHVVSQDR